MSKPITRQAENQRRFKLGLVPIRGWVLDSDKPKADKLTDRGEAAYAAKYETKSVEAMLRIANCPDKTSHRMDEMEAKDHEPDSGRIEVGKPKGENNDT